MNKLIVLLFSALLFLSGCRSVPQQTTKNVVVREVVNEIVKDSIIQLPADSAWLHALLECDSLGNVLIKQLSEIHNGDKIKPPIITIIDNKLEAISYIDSADIYITWKEKHIQRDSIHVEIREPPPVYINKLTTWQTIRLRIADIVLYGGLILLIIILHKRFKIL